MYTEFYGLDEKPFALLPDPRFLYLGSSHREALAHLLYGIEEGEGFILVVGQVGTGKTTLCRTLLDRVGHDVDIAFIFNPSRSELELLTAITREFGLPTTGKDRSELMDDLNEFLLKGKAAGRRMILVIDEAQNLSAELLEQVRLLSNLETEREKLLQIVLIGQPELEENLAKTELRQLRQRITVRWDLRPFDRAETDEYVNHRLRVAGRRTGRPLFSPTALRALYRASGGTPRVINALADRALLAGYAEARERIDAKLVRASAQELSVRSHRRLPSRRLLLSAGASAAVSLATVGAFWWLGRAPATAPEAQQTAQAPEPQTSVDAEPPAPPSLPPTTVATKVASPPGLSATAEGTDLVALAPVLEERGVEGSVADALAQLLYLWGYVRPIPIEVDPNAIAATVREVSPLSVHEGLANLDQISRLNLPVILELDLPSDAVRYVALQRLDTEGSAIVAAADRIFVLPAETLYKYWVGRTYFLWVNYERMKFVQLGSEGTAVRWLQEKLTQLGYMRPGDPSGQFDAVTEAAVRKFQASYSVRASGEVGPETLIALYNALGYQSPKLQEPLGDPR